MARRERVTRLKSHRKTRNKNPKLSPFQKELKRSKLANQPPVIKAGQRDAPKSQKLVLEYLQKKKEKKELKRAELQERRRGETKIDSGIEGESETSRTEATHEVVPSSADEILKRKETSSSSQEPGGCTHPSLNALLASSLKPLLVSSSSLPSSTETDSTSSASIIARKKAKKHEKRVKIRQEKVKEQTEKMSKELELLSRKKGKRKKDLDENAMWEKKLIQMQREKELEERKAKKMQKMERNALEAESTQGLNRKVYTSNSMEEETVSGVAPNKKKGKRITFEDEHIENMKTVESTRAKVSFSASDHSCIGEEEIRSSTVACDHDKKIHTPATISPSSLSSRKRARDFCDLVDVVGFNERVEAPPVFTSVPNVGASLSRLARKLEEKEEGSIRGSTNKSQNVRQRLFSSVSGLGEQKRLSRLGLLETSTDVSHTLSPFADASLLPKLSKEKEMELLRTHVMAAYRKTRRRSNEKMNKVDMMHQFPQI